MTFVVDASVVLAWCLEDESSEAAHAAIGRLMTEGAIAPAHWPVEVASALRAAERRARLDVGSLGQLIPRLTALPVEILPVEFSTALSVIETARRYELTVYDACYLHIAEFRGMPIATVDRRLMDACKEAGIPLIAV